MKYKFQCDCCGGIAETDNDNINDAVLAIKHEKGCNDGIGAPWHPVCLFDFRFPNRPKI